MGESFTTAAHIHRGSIVIVDHDHRPIGPDLIPMRTGGVSAKVYQITLDVDPEAGFEASKQRTAGWLHLAIADMERALRDIDTNSQNCFLARTAADIRRAKAEDRIAILLGAEGARWLEESLEPLHLFHRLGLRQLQLTWAFPNPLVPDGHLSTFGKTVVAACKDLGILVDVTHIPEPAFYDVVEMAQQPLIVSHGALGKDVDDDKLRALAASGGLLGIHFYTSYLGPTPTPADVVEQIDAVVERVGIDHVALGVDFFPTEGAWRDLQIAQGTTELRWAVEDMSAMPRITHCLVERGYAEDDIQKILGLNFLRICKEVFGA